MRALYFLFPLPSLFICNEVQEGKKTRAWIGGRFMENLLFYFIPVFDFQECLLNYYLLSLISHLSYLPYVCPFS